MKKTILFAILTIFLINSNLVYSKYRNRVAYAEKGVLDLRSHEHSNQTRIYLSGKWEFYWNSLLSPNELKGRKPKWYVDVPSMWGDITLFDSSGREIKTNFPGAGYATYALDIIISNTNKSYALYVPNCGSAYRIWINDIEGLGNGCVSTNTNKIHAQYIPRIYEIVSPQITNRLVVQTANLKYRSGGIWSYFDFGLLYDINNDFNRHRMLEVLLIGGLLLIGLYQIGLFVFRRDDFSPLLFAFFCLNYVGRIALTGTYSIYEIFPGISWEFIVGAEFFTFYAGMGFISALLYSLFRRSYNYHILRVIITVCIVFCLTLVLLPVSIFTGLLIYFQVFALLVGIYLLFGLVVAVFQREEGAGILLLGAIVLMLCFLNDVLYYMGILPYFGIITSIGMMIYIVLQSMMMSVRLSRAFSSVEVLSEETQKNIVELKRTKKSLEEYQERLESMIEKRTRQVNRTNAELRVEIEERIRNTDKINRLSMVVEQSASMIVITDLNGKIEYVNPKFCEVTGYSREEVLGGLSNILKSGETTPEEYKLLWDTIENGKEWEGYFSNRKKNGEIYYERASIGPFKDSSGKITNYTKVAEDMTQQKKYEDALNRANALLKSLIDSIPDPIFYENRKHVYLGCNKAFLEFEGWNKSQVYGKRVDELYSPEMSRAYIEIEDRVMESGKHIRTEEWRKAESGNEYLLDRLTTPYFDLDGEILGVIGISRDMTEIKRLNEELRDAIHRIENANNGLLESNKILENDLDIARSIQLSMIPSKSPSSRVAMYYKAMERVGGDYLDFIRLRDKERLGVFISDVSGHGVPAAFVTTLINSYLQRLRDMVEKPEEMLNELNDVLLGQTGGNFITAMYGIVNWEKKIFRYASAGHNPPILIRKGKGSYVNGSKRGLPLSMMERKEQNALGKSYGENLIKLERGDKILLYTDGLTEAINIEEQKKNRIERIKDFESERLFEVLSNSTDLSSEELVSKLKDELIEYRGAETFEDDICIVCIEV